MAYFRSYLILNACKHTEFAFNGYIILVCVVYYLLSERNVLLVGERRAVYHNRREAEVYATLAQFEAVSVVEVKNYFGVFAAEFFCILNGTLCHVAQKRGVCIVARTFRYLEYYRRAQL